MKTKEKETLIIIILVVLGAVGILLYKLLQDKNSITGQNSTSNVIQEVVPKTTVDNSVILTNPNRISFEELLHKDSNKCTFSLNNGISGEAQIKSGAIYYKNSNSNTKTDSYSVYKDSTLWSWLADSTNGITLKIVPGSTFEDKSKEQVEKMFKELLQNDLNCTTVVVNDDSFSVPQSVSFIDLNSMLEQISK